jgi:hypothetical protein
VAATHVAHGSKVGSHGLVVLAVRRERMPIPKPRWPKVRVQPCRFSALV